MNNMALVIQRIPALALAVEAFPDLAEAIDHLIDDVREKAFKKIAAKVSHSVIDFVQTDAWPVWKQMGEDRRAEAQDALLMFVKYRIYSAWAADDGDKARYDRDADQCFGTMTALLTEGRLELEQGVKDYLKKAGLSIVEKFIP